MTIWKYPVEITDFQTIAMPAGAELLAFQLQDGVPTLWALVDERRPMGARRLLVVGTGNPFPENKGRVARYVGTIQQRGFVWHLFDEYYE